MTSADLARFKVQLLDMRPRLAEEVQRSIEAVQEEVQPPGEDAKEPSEGLEKELALESNQEEMLNAINAALDRIEQGTYGRCIECGKPIPQARLKALPYAAHCVDCERAVETR